MPRLLVLAILLSASVSLLADSSAEVKIQMTAVTPRVIVEPQTPPPAARQPRAPRETRRDLRRRRIRVMRASRHVPRPLSPGEFGRARPGL